MRSPPHRPPLCRRMAGFTLIEISIVLVIIGLIVGGILLGQDLIRAATIRAQISQIEKYTTAFNTFKIKYRYLPGDLPSTWATSLGFFAETTLGTTVGHQDGNGLIQVTELVGAWRHLTDAQMVDGNYGTATAGNPLDPTTGWVTTTTIPGTTQFIIPPAKLGKGNFVWAEAFPTTNNAFRIARVTEINSAVFAGFAMANGISPIEAQQIDSKMDDGLAQTGKVISTSYIFGTCLAGAPLLYSIALPNGDTPQCTMIIWPGF